METKKKIVTVGTIFVDIKGYPLGAFLPGSGRNAGRIEQVNGGVARNIAEDLANIGLESVLVSLIDGSGAGLGVIDALKGRVDTRYVKTAPDGMGTWLAVFDDKGDVAAQISKRPDLRELTTLFRENGEAIVKDADALITEIDIEPETLEVMFGLCEKRGVPVFGCVSNMTEAAKRKEYIAKLDCLTCNLDEAGILFDRDFSENTPEEALRELSSLRKDLGMKSLVVTMGERGAVYLGEGGEQGICPTESVNVVDTTGAGDAFCAGVAAGIANGKSLGEACALGTKLALSVITTTQNVCPAEKI